MRRTLTLQKVPIFAPDVDVKPVDAPTGGWDAISPLAKMDPKFAVVLENWVPRTGYVELRKGYNVWCQALTASAIETLMTYRPPGASEKLFAAGGGSIWDVSSEGLPSLSASGHSGSRWQYVNFTPGAPGALSYLVAVNGTDSAQIYDGTSWADASVTGVALGTLVNVCVHKRRLWFIQNQSTSAWYLAVDAIAGAATQFFLGPLMTKGGHLVAMGTWTIDGGYGPDDYAVFVTSRGQIILYKGIDPAVAADWELVGVFDVAPPLGRRCFYRSGADLWLITLEGLIPISQALPFNPSAVRSAALTSRIQNAMLNAAKSAQSAFGWEVVSYPAEGLVVMNVPIQENASQMQFVLNMLTGAWCKFTGWNANCFGLYDDVLYFGDNAGSVHLAYTSVADLVEPISADMKCAFNYFGTTGRRKRMTMIQPLLVSSGAITPTMGVDVDFGDVSPSALTSSITPVGATYDASVYDTGTYAEGDVTLTHWLSVTAEGLALAVRMKVNVVPSGAGAESVFDTGVFDAMVFDGFASEEAVLRVNAFNAMMEYGSNV